MTTSSSRDRSAGPRHVVRLLRMALALAIAFLTVPFLTLAPAYADDSSTASGDVTATEVVDPPPASTADQPPADTSAAPTPAPAAQEAPAPESPTTSPDTSTSTSTSTGGTSGGGGATTLKSSSVTSAATTAAPDCTVTDFDQNTLESGAGTWLNGALNQQNSNYAEGDFVPQRVELGGLVPGTYTLGFTFDRTKSGKYAYDYVAGLDISGSSGATATWSSSVSDFNGPAPTHSPGGTYTVAVTITFTITDATDPTATLLWTGHIASELDYGPGSGAGSISGAPYHFSLTSTTGTWGCDAGNRDNQLMADAVEAGTVTIIKDAQPNAAQDFHFTLAAPNGLNAAFNLDDDSDATLPNTVTYRVPPGTSTAAEVNIPDGWNLTGLTCTVTADPNGGATVATSLATHTATLGLVDDSAITCTFTNSRASTLEVDKEWVINGGTPVAEGSAAATSLGLSAQLTVDGANKPWDTALTGYLQGATVSLNESATLGNPLCTWAGATHGSVTEVNGTAPASTTLPHDVTLDGGANHATITNAVTCSGALVLKKVVDNTNGGTAVPGDFTLVASPAGGGADLTTAGSTAGHTFTVAAGATYNLSETGGPAHYTLAGIDCGSGAVTSVQVPAGQTRTCTFTNHDNPGHLTLVKNVDHNGTGDTTPASAWTLTATASSGGGATISGTTGVTGATKAGTYALSESNGPAAYDPSVWTCLAGTAPVPVTSGSVALAMGQDVTCTITNTAIKPHLTLVKIVNHNGTDDTTDASAFTLTATPEIAGRATLSGPGPEVTGDVMVGTYDLSESGPVGYDASPDGWQCVDAEQHTVGLTGTAAITLAVGDDITCTITNIAVPATVEVDKYWQVNGGTPVLDGSQPANLQLQAQLLVNGHAQAWDTVIGGFLRGAPLTLGESVTIGNDLCRQTSSRLVESHGSAVSPGATLPYSTTVLGGTNHYTILNTVQCASELTLVKHVDHGTTGDETAADAFTLTADPTLAGEPDVTGNGTATSAVKEGTFVLSETGPSTYAADLAGWSCKAGDTTLSVTDSTVTVPLATSVTCTILNHAIPSEWTVSKTSDPPSGSTVLPGDQIDYTVTLAKVGNGVPVEDFNVIDTLTGVQDSWVSGLPAGATIDNGKITWHIDELGDTPLQLTYTVTVGADAWNSEIDNVVTPGPVPCLDVDGVDCDHTEHFTPHYTLDKSVKLLANPGDGDTLAEPGEQLQYTLTVTNDTDHAFVDTVITDDVSDVLDNAAVVSLGAGLTLDGTKLSWTIDDLAPGQTTEVSYVVQIDAGAWGVTLHNVATPVPGDGGECIPAGDVPGGTDDNAQCETTTDTPPVTTMVVEKRDLESDEVLSGATFQLWSAGAIPEGGCDFGSPVTVGSGDTLVGTETTGTSGQSLFHDLQHGCYILVETAAPAGYDLPAHPVMGIQVDELNFVNGGLMSPIVVTDFAEGQLAIVAKKQYEKVGDSWVESDGKVGFGDTVRYVVRVAATGPKNFHNVEVTDYVPGYNPDDHVSTVKGSLVAGSATCAEGLTCSATVDPATQLVTWNVGDLEPANGATIGGTAVMDVVFPEAPADLVLTPGQVYTSTLWNVGFLGWDEAVEASNAGAVARLATSGGGGAGARVASARTVELPMVHHTLTSNEVVVSASMTGLAEKTLPGKTAGAAQLPQTGAPASILPLGFAAFVLIGAGLFLTRRKEEAPIRREEE